MLQLMKRNKCGKYRAEMLLKVAPSVGYMDLKIRGMCQNPKDADSFCAASYSALKIKTVKIHCSKNVCG